ncbi:GPI mannosyltransferase 1-like [Schistocerca piceifrons]|uniref:GPI mannosyltransferase 1-like n=1 Tax=Schistocerca piceifrons TaxID=274613 RepID=UPI001F5E45C3|nr:GPI mannosyltransferase 1-like [Schistocerca piceifrons]
MSVSNIYLHCLVGFFIRLLLVVYGEVHDKLYVVQYTDIDYHVFTDAAHHIVSGRSPYDRHTYRYTPLLAAFLVPNVLFHPAFGKVLFSFIDVVVAYIIHRLLLTKGCSQTIAINCSLMWLYNPFPIVICTRGNADAISAALVLASLLSVQKGCSIMTGIIHAIATHVRLYPLVFTLPIYISVKGDSASQEEKHTSLGKVFPMLFPDRQQLKFAVSFIVVLAATTLFFYWLYGYQFLHESFLYHIARRDTRHNFSVYFYMLYLTSDVPLPLWQRIFVVFPQFVLLIVLSFVYGSRKDLDFCVLAQAIVMVTYNTVVTSQYFIWFLSVLPVCVPFIAIPSKQAATFFVLWISAQIAWLLPAYLLEFQGRDTFMYVWLQGIAFFSINITVLVRFVQTYKSCCHSKLKSI